jgi:hypothetical protein
MRLWPGTDWNMIWRNLHETPATEDVKMDWYKVIHLIPTKDRLQRINITATNQCNQCQAKDTLQHRLIECRDGRQIWKWTQGRIAIMLRTNAKKKKKHTRNMDRVPQCQDMAPKTA